MCDSTALAKQRHALESAFAKHDDLVEIGADSSALAAAEHQIYLESKALTTTLTHPGVFVLHQVFESMIHSATVVAIQLNIVDLIENETTLAELTSKTGADQLMLFRIMRVLVSAGIFRQPRRNVYAATGLSRRFRERPARNWAISSLTIMNKVGIVLPEALAEDNYHNPEDPARSAMTKAFGGTSLWEILEKDEKARKMFDAAMEQQDDLPAEMIPDHEVDWVGLLGDVSAKQVAFVDVGGGSGHAMLKIKEATDGQIRGRFVLQDRKLAIDAVPVTTPDAPFETMVHDFFEKQPIKGAKVYHIRRCLHDWSDSKCEQILRHIRDAMTPGYSRVLIHEFVLPVMGCEPRELLFDVLMMCLTGAERDEDQWKTLLARCGLIIVKVWTSKIGHMGIIEAETV